MRTATLSFYALLALCFVMSGVANAAPPEFDPLVRELNSPQVESRRKAAQTLARLGPDAAPVIEALVGALDDQDAYVRFEVLKTIGKIGPAAKAAVPALVDILKVETSPMQVPALQALAGIGFEAKEALPELRKIVAQGDAAITPSAAFALARVTATNLARDNATAREDWSPVIPRLLAGLADKRSHVRQDAVTALVEIGAPAVPALTELVKQHVQNPDGAIRGAAVLRLIGAPAVPAAPVLIEALASSHERVVVVAIDALGAIGAKADSAVPELRKLLGNRIAAVRSHAAASLAEFGPAAATALRELTEALRDPDADVRRTAARALGNIGKEARPAAPALVQALADAQGAVTVQAAAALARLGESAVPALIPLLQDASWRGWSVQILGDIGPEAKEAVGPLVVLMKGDIDTELRREVVLTLASIGPAARDATPDLVALLENDLSDARAAAAFALIKIGAKEVLPLLPKTLQDEKTPLLREVSAWGLVTLSSDHQKYASFLIPVLVNGLRHPIDLARIESAAALSRLGSAASSTAPALIAAFQQEKNPNARREMLAALGQINPEPAPALQSIKVALNDSDYSVKYTAYYALGSLGPAASQEIPLLVKNLQDRDEFLQIVSAWALIRISPQTQEVVSKALPLLTKGLEILDPRARFDAASALGELGPAARNALPALQKIEEKDTEEAVRKAAAEAIRKINAVARAPKQEC